MTAILALSCGAATSQTTGSSRVLNTQLQFGDVISGQTLDVVDSTQSIQAVTTATGNHMLAGSQGRNLSVTSSQEMQGGAYAHTVVNATGDYETSGNVTTAATGNTADAAISRATLTATINQTTGAVGITSIGQVEGAELGLTDLTHGTQAVANSAGVALTNSSVGARVTQNSAASVMADGGAIVGATSGQATVSANAAGNNFTATGVQQSAQRLIATQNNLGDMVQASKFTAYGQSYLSVTNATAQGNNVHATNEGPLLDVATDQTNTAYVRAQAEATSAAYSSSQVTAYGAGNSTLAGNYGAEVLIDNNQFNTGGGVEVIAVSDLGGGWDSSASASAVGNAVTGYACAACTGKMTVTNNQTNEAEIGATTTARSQYGRSVNGLASAVGNTASYYVSAPSSSAQ